MKRSDHARIEALFAAIAGLQCYSMDWKTLAFALWCVALMCVVTAVYFGLRGR